MDDLSPLVRAVLSDVPYSEARALEMIRAPNWQASHTPDDWRRYIPASLREVWDQLDLSAQASAFAVADAYVDDLGTRAAAPSSPPLVENIFPDPSVQVQPGEQDTFILSASTVQDVLDVLSGYLDVNFEADYVLGLLRKRPELVGNILAWDAHDTEVRGQICDLVTEDLQGRRVPTNGEARNGFDSDAFYEAVAREAASRGVGRPSASER